MRKGERRARTADGPSGDQGRRPGCCGILLRLIGGFQETSSQAKRLPYRLRDDFLSPAELSFLHVLEQVVGDRAAVCPKVNLSDLFFVPSSENSMAHHNRIAQKHLDFLLCDPDAMCPLVGIELDDSSHRSKRGRERDAFEDAVFEAAGLPLLRVPQKHAYDPKWLAEQLAGFLEQLPTPEPISAGSAGKQAVMENAVPLCPKCAEAMVLRTASKGKNRGERFYGCPNFPRCRETIQINGSSR